MMCGTQIVDVIENVKSLSLHRRIANAWGTPPAKCGRRVCAVTAPNMRREQASALARARAASERR